MSDAEREAARARMVEFWRHYDALEARLTRPVSERMLDLAGVGPELSVLDVAAGRGEPALPAAQRVGPRGRVLAIDAVEGVLQLARERAQREGLTNVEFRVADAESLDLGGERFDVATVRWGLMFLRVPERALASIHRALRPGGRLVTASWAEPARVSWAGLARRLLERHCPVPPIDLGAPGAFRHADPKVLERELVGAGFEVLHEEELEIPVAEAASPGELVDWIRALGGPVNALADALPEAQRRAWEQELVEALEQTRAHGKVSLGGVTRLTLAARK